MRPLPAKSAFLLTPLRLLHLAAAFALFVWMSWLLLIPDPYSTSRALEHIGSLDLNGFLIHMCAYATVTMALLSTTRSEEPGPVGVILSVMLTHAGVTEWMQSFVPGRSTEMLDLAANISGVSLAWSVLLLVRRVPETAESPALCVLNVDRLHIRPDN